MRRLRGRSPACQNPHRCALVSPCRVTTGVTAGAPDGVSNAHETAIKSNHYTVNTRLQAVYTRCEHTLPPSTVWASAIRHMRIRRIGRIRTLCS